MSTITHPLSNVALVMTFVAASFFSESSLRAAPIGPAVTFETLTDAATTPTDDAELAIDDPYELDNGVELSFSFLDPDTGLFDVPGRFEQRDDDGTDGFISFWGDSDRDSGQPAYDSMLGDFFLRSQGTVGQTGGEVTLRIDYEIPNGLEMKFAAGEIWDIDAFPGQGNEQWTVTAFNASDVAIDSVTSPLGIVQTLDPAENPDQFDSRPWVFELNTDESIAYVLVNFVGTKEMDAGLGFNNFTTAVTNPIPEPASLALLGIGSAAMLLTRKRWRRAASPISLNGVTQKGRPMKITASLVLFALALFCVPAAQADTFGSGADEAESRGVVPVV